MYVCMMGVGVCMYDGCGCMYVWMWVYVCMMGVGVCMYDGCGCMYV